MKRITLPNAQRLSQVVLDRPTWFELYEPANGHAVP